jgi:hypothetical protein
MRSEMERRVAAAQKTLDRYKDRPFSFEKGCDCGKLTAFHLRQMGRPIPIAKAGSYKSLLGAQRALRRLGFNSLEELMDAHFERVPPAAAWVGDVIAMRGQEGPGSLTVAVGNGRVLGFHEDYVGAVVMQPAETLAAWRIL